MKNVFILLMPKMEATTPEVVRIPYESYRPDSMT